MLLHTSWGMRERTRSSSPGGTTRQPGGRLSTLSSSTQGRSPFTTEARRDYTAAGRKAFYVEQLFAEHSPSTTARLHGRWQQLSPFTTRQLLRAAAARRDYTQLGCRAFSGLHQRWQLSPSMTAYVVGDEGEITRALAAPPIYDSPAAPGLHERWSPVTGLCPFTTAALLPGPGPHSLRRWGRRRDFRQPLRSALPKILAGRSDNFLRRLPVHLAPFGHLARPQNVPGNRHSEHLNAPEW
jgi:hypothetical protein